MPNNEKLKILVVDDQPGMRESLEGIFELEGYEVYAFDDGYKAIEKAKEVTFDIAFLDIKMPGINGVDTFLQIKKISPSTIVFMMTAYANSDLIDKALQQGAHTCIYKPLNLDAIINFLSKIQKSQRVLIVDRSLNAYKEIKTELIEKGYHVTIVSNIIETINYLYKKPVDFVVIDLENNEFYGIEIIKDIKKVTVNSFTPKIIAIYAEDINDIVKQSFEAGADKFFQKPISAKFLADSFQGFNENASNTKILVIDDDDLFSKSLCQILNEAGYETENAKDGAQAIEKIENNNFKIVLLDIKLPDTNGIELYSKITQSKPGINVILMTAFSKEEFISNVVKNGNYTFLQKPIEPEQILKIIQEKIKTS